MPTNTISFSKKSNGWNSFHSYEPDWMIGMNSSLYTWKNGDLYEHHNNVVMNEYYGTTYSSTIKTVFNEGPTESKMFKTICIEGDVAWDVSVVTDSAFTGEIATAEFKEKEGTFYGYIRRLSGAIDPSLLSMQGIGEVSGFAGTTLTMTNAFSTDFIVAAKNSVAESYGLRGGYMEVELSTASATNVELFSISSDIFKSYP